MNANETLTLKALADEIQKCSFGDYGLINEAVLPEGTTRKEFKATVTRLAEKKLLVIGDTWGTVQLTEAGIDKLRKAGHYTGIWNSMFAAADRNGDWV